MAQRVPATVFLPDIHAPYHDPAAVRCALKLTKAVQPTTLVYLGDAVDFHPISRYDRDPKRILSLQDEIDTLREIMDEFHRAAMPDTVIFMAGNHEARLQTYLWKHPEISSLDCLRVPALLGFEADAARLYRYVEYGQHIMHNGIAVLHGDRVSSASAATAAAMFRHYGVSGISGHTHRAGDFRKRTLLGEQRWIESGCLAKFDPGWTKGLTDWQHAITVGHWFPDDQRFDLQIVPINNGIAVYGGAIFDGNK